MDINYQLLDNIVASIYWKNLGGVYLGCNKYMLAMAGLQNREQIVGKTDYDLPWRKQANKIRDIDQLVVQNNKTYELEENPLVHEGVLKTFLSSKTPLKEDDGTIIGIVGVSIDITEKNRLEELLKETEKSLEESRTIKERFLKNISHETRNPLQAFVCTAELLEEKWDTFSDKERYESVKLIATSSRRLVTLVTNTFDLSDIISNNVKLKLRKNNITKLIRESIERIKLSYSCNIVLNATQEFHLVFDEEKIRQVVSNLLMNAIKWTKKEKIVTVELYSGLLPNSCMSGIICCIRDQGIKIPEKELEFIFEPFTESSNTASKACGVGLGLALCKEIIRMHMGEIWAENNIGEGVTLNFMIPNIHEENT
jgi:two-component system aerobic respiration control sensor histidine kinase ArcB